MSGASYRQIQAMVEGQMNSDIGIMSLPGGARKALLGVTGARGGYNQAGVIIWGLF